MRRIIVIAAALTLVSAALPVFATGGTESTAPQSSADMGSMAKKLEITWLTPMDASPWKDGNAVEQLLEPLFNVDLKTIPINSMDAEKLKVTFAGGTIPDVLVYWTREQSYKDGVIRAFDPEWIKKYMPKTWQAIDQLGGKVAWEKSVSDVDGKTIAIPNIWVHSDARLVLAARQDWLNNLGIAKLPSTVDELYAVAKAFTFSDPDKNGKADTYGFGGAGLHPNPMFWQFQTVMGAYGVHPQKWIVEDGQVTFGAVANGYKEFLKTMAKWYKDGVVDPEFLTDQNATYGNKVGAGRLGFYDGHPTYFDLSNKALPPSILNQKDANAKFVFLEPPKGPQGKSGAISYGLVPDWGMQFGSKTSDEKVIRAMQIGETTNNDVKLLRAIIGGKEGVSYDLAGEQVVYKTGVVPAEYGANLYRTTMVQTWERARVLLSPAGVALIEPTTRHPLLTDVVNAGKVNAATMDKVNQAEMDKLAKEYYFNAIAGKVDVDATWAAYVKQFNDLGNTIKTEAARKLPRYY
jgi:putative aldouronate transport system substrate-binding protein